LVFVEQVAADAGVVAATTDAERAAASARAPNFVNFFMKYFLSRV
jgi:hypothetical protein